MVKVGTTTGGCAVEDTVTAPALVGRNSFFFLLFLSSLLVAVAFSPPEPPAPLPSTPLTAVKCDKFRSITEVHKIA